MPIIIGIFCVLPLVFGLAAEYVVCRFLRRKMWRILPPALILVLTGVVTAGRLNVWEAQASPVTQLLFVPGLPALCALAGTALGWRLWKRLWAPRVIWEKRRRD